MISVNLSIYLEFDENILSVYLGFDENNSINQRVCQHLCINIQFSLNNYLNYTKQKWLG